MRPKSLFFVLVLLGVLWAPLLAQEVEDILDFFNKGKELYSKQKWREAALEFENVLMLDSKHLDAKIFLVKIYGNLKETKKAQDLLKGLQSQAPSNAEVKELVKLFGSQKPRVPTKESDLVLHETLTLLGAKPALRPFGLVIPEEKIRKKPGEEPEAGSGSVVVHPESIPVASETEPPSLEDKDKKVEEGPLFEVFDTWALDGLNAGLEKYFEVVGPDKSLGALDDRNLLAEGRNFFSPRFEANPKDDEARYFLGMIAFFSGEEEKSQNLLEPIRESERAKTKGAEFVFGEFDRKKAEEEARQAAIRKAEEAKAARKRAEEEAKAAAIAAAQAAAASGTTGTNPSEPVVAAASGTPEAVDAEGYDLYKKGQLDPAIEKYEQAIKTNPNEPKFHYHFGLALTDKALAGNLDSFDRAIEAFNSVMRLSPGSKLARDAEIMIRDIAAAKASIKP